MEIPMRFFALLYLMLAPFAAAQSNDYGKPVEDPVQLLESFQNFWSYQHAHLQLSDDFIGLDGTSSRIEKGAFLRKLVTGRYLPIRLQSGKSAYLRLLKVAFWKVPEIRNTIVNLAKIELEHFEMENTLFPEFNVEDLDGCWYSNETVKGKTLILKLWFIGCQQCIEEMPALNKLLNTYKGNNDMVFLSMALDTKEALRNFLKKRKFDYPVVGDQDDFLKNALRIQRYPTHIIVDKAGKIVKVVNSIGALKKALKENS